MVINHHPTYLTLGDIARRLEVPIHRAKYAIEAHGIEPAMRAGITRLWEARDLATIKSAVDRVAGNHRRRKSLESG